MAQVLSIDDMLVVHFGVQIMSFFIMVPLHLH